MRKAIVLSLVLGVLLFSVVGFAVFDEDISELLDDIRGYGQQYENNEITYLQLKVLTEITGEKVSSSIGKRIFEIEFEGTEHVEHYEGVSAEDLKSILGEPTEMTDWVWVVNRERGMKVSKPVPRWEKVIFMGTKVKIALEAYPHVIMYEGPDDKPSYLPYYWIGFNIWFLEEQEDLDVDSMVNNIKDLATDYYNTGTGKDELISSIIDAEKILHNYMEINREDCLEVVDEINKGTKTESKILRREGDLYSGENFDIRLNFHECHECEWNWMNFDFWLETHMKEYEIEVGDFQETSVDYYEAMSTDALFDELEIELTQLKIEAVIYDRTRNPTFANTFVSMRGKLATIGRILDQRVNSPDRKLKPGEKISADERGRRIDIIFDELVENGRKEMVTQVERHDRLFTDEVQKTHSYCQHNSQWCGKGMSCENAQCVPYTEEWEEPYEEPKTFSCEEHCWTIKMIPGDAQCTDGNWKAEDPGLIVEKEDLCVCYYECPEEMCPPGKCEDGDPCTINECDSATGECIDGGFYEEGTPCGNGNICQSGVCSQPPQPTGGFLTGYVMLENECDLDSVCLAIGATCRGDRWGNNRICSLLGYSEGEACSIDRECESEICHEGTCAGGGPASQMCGNGACDEHEKTDGLRPCLEDCADVEDCQVGCCLEPDPEAFCGGPCTICNYKTGECVPSTAPECQRERPCDTGCCLVDDPWLYCGGTTDVWCNFDTGECEVQDVETGCCLVEDVEAYCGESHKCDYETCECFYVEKDEPREWTCMEHGCNPHQYCNVDTGWCECESEWYNHDGDWINGCESSEKGGDCQSDADCAPSRCSEDGWNIDTFQCVQGDEWKEERAGFEYGAGCVFKQSGKPDHFVWFGGWGEKFDELEGIRRSMEVEFKMQWCERELNSALKTRAELESSFKQDFAQWFFDEIITKNPGEFEIHMRALGSAYWSLVDTNRRIAENMKCLKMTEWPESEPISVDWETAYGRIVIWEEFITTDYFGEPMEVLSPYAKFWAFPPKDMFKHIIREEFAAGKLGPDDEKKGPSPQEREMIRQDPELMGVINSISNRFGGEADIYFELVDDTESVAGILIEIDPDIIIQVTPHVDYTGERDVTLIAQFDFFYEMISSAEKGKAQHTETPPWDRSPRITDDMGGAVDGMVMFIRMALGVASGDIVVEPPEAWGDVIFTFREIITMMMMGMK